MLFLQKSSKKTFFNLKQQKLSENNKNYQKTTKNERLFLKKSIFILFFAFFLIFGQKKNHF